MRPSDILRAHRDEIVLIAARRGATNVRVFGSVARGEDDGASDLDLLVDLEPGPSLLDLGALLSELEQRLGLKVDVVTPETLRPRIRARVLSKATPL